MKKAEFVVWDDFCQATDARGLAEVIDYLRTHGWPDPRDPSQVMVWEPDGSLRPLTPAEEQALRSLI